SSLYVILSPSLPFLSFSLISQPPRFTLFPYTTLFRSSRNENCFVAFALRCRYFSTMPSSYQRLRMSRSISGNSIFKFTGLNIGRSEEHTSELQSRSDLVCRLLLEKKKK